MSASAYDREARGDESQDVQRKLSARLLVARMLMQKRERHEQQRKYSACQRYAAFRLSS